MAVIGNDDIYKMYAAHDGGAIIHTGGILQTSDKRIKEDINEIGECLPFINSLKPVTYRKKQPDQYPKELQEKMYPNGKPRKLDDEEIGRLNIGLIAQEVKDSQNKLNPDLSNIVNIDVDSGLYSLSYDKLIVPIIKALQELKKEKDDGIKIILSQLASAN